MRSLTMRCSRRSLSLRSSCSPRWSSTAGSELRRVEPARATVETLAPERRTSSSGLAPVKAASGVPQQKQKQAGNWSRIAPNRAAGSWAEPASTITSRASTTLLISPAPIRSVAAATAASNSAGGRALRISAWAVGCGSSSGNGSSRRPASRASAAATRAAASSPGPTSALTVRKVRSPLRQSESSGRTSEPGASEDQAEDAAALRREGEAAEPDRPGAGRQPGRLVDDAVAAAAQALGGDVAEAARAARSGLVGDAEAGEGEAAVGLLPAEPAVGGQARGEDRRAGVGDIDLAGDADERPLPAGESAVDRIPESG